MKNNNTVITIDLDGTLLNNSNQLIGGENTATLIKELQNLNCEIVINTGRLDHDIISVSEKFDLPRVKRISQNGAVLINNEIIKSHVLDKEEALNFWHYAKNLFLRVEVNTISNRYWLEERPKDFVREFYSSEKIVSEYETLIKFQPVTLFLVIGEGQQIIDLRKYVEDQFKNIYPVQTSANSLEILAKGVSKGAGMKELFPSHYTYAIGDSENDYSLFEVADKSFYVGFGKHPYAESVQDIKVALDKILTELKGEKN